MVAETDVETERVSALVGLFVTYCDNYKCVSSIDKREAEGRPNIIVMHPDFRMLVLANRPGFPFLGNDFFGALGTYTCTQPEAED